MSQVLVLVLVLVPASLVLVLVLVGLVLVLVLVLACPVLVNTTGLLPLSQEPHPALGLRPFDLAANEKFLDTPLTQGHRDRHVSILLTFRSNHVGLSRTVSETDGDFSGKSEKKFLYPCILRPR